MSISAEEIYNKHIKSLPVAIRLRLLELTARELARDETIEPQKKRSLLELEGLGAEIWQDIDTQAYVNNLRDEWDHRP